MIISAAILLNGIIYTGRNHEDIRDEEDFKKAMKKAREEHWAAQGTEGFVDEYGAFHNRKQAAKIAFECGQIKEKTNQLKSWQLK